MLPAIASARAWRLIYQSDHYNKILKIVNSVASKLQFDEETVKKYRYEIGADVDEILFGELQFSSETRLRIQTVDLEIISFAIVCFFVSYVVGDKKNDEFPEFFGEILNDEKKKG